VLVPCNFPDAWLREPLTHLVHWVYKDALSDHTLAVQAQSYGFTSVLLPSMGVNLNASAFPWMHGMTSWCPCLRRGSTYYGGAAKMSQTS